jgi:hypothetical protein
MAGFSTRAFMLGAIAGLVLVLIQPVVLKTLGLNKAA